MIDRQLHWRLLKHKNRSGAWNMALDEVLMHRTGRAPKPTAVLRFYSWQPAAITLGYSQKRPEQYLDLEACRREGIEWVRRLTGGRAVLHRQEVTYSIIIPERYVPSGVLKSYQVLSQGLLNGLRRLGLAAELAEGCRRHHRTNLCFDAPSWYELVLNGKKVIGSAQARKQGVLLQHGSVPIHTEPARLAFYLPAPSESAKERLYRQALQQSACLSRWLGDDVREDEIIEAFTAGFQQAFGGTWRDDVLTPEEEQQTLELAESRYRSA